MGASVDLFNGKEERQKKQVGLGLEPMKMRRNNLEEGTSHDFI